ncbi:M20 aminoacylase family protein [Saezia sanguinis]|uniref:M20 aminoacylase family protein n=1 Tax=Saezia sanguinis TaxID=1965230 RepID=UPI0030498D97
MSLIDEIRVFHDEFTQIRRDLHAHPEPAFQETRTAKIITELLAAWGLEVHTGVGQTGVVGVLRGSAGKSRHAIGLRADMDALPMQEKTGLAHASTVPGAMHGCGHDGHTTILLYAAKWLSQHRDFAGTVNFIFQPAEELPPGGAKAMLDDGLFERFPCDEIYGLHNRPGLPLGHIGLTAGVSSASSNSFEITLKGVGGHAAMPHKTVDPVVIGAEVVLALQTLISRHKNPDTAAVLSVTQFHAGDAYNVIPDEAVLKGTMRTFDMQLIDDIEAGMRCMVEMLPAMHGGSGVLSFERGYPVLLNHEPQRQFVIAVAETLFGKDHVDTHFPRRSGSEDFAYYLQKVPGCFAQLGIGNNTDGGQGVREVHHPCYDFNDEALPYGAAFWVSLVQAFFARK